MTDDVLTMMTNESHYKVVSVRLGTGPDETGTSVVVVELTAPGLDRPCVLTLCEQEVDDLISAIARQAAIAKQENAS